MLSTSNPTKETQGKVQVNKVKDKTLRNHLVRLLESWLLKSEDSDNENSVSEDYLAKLEQAKLLAKLKSVDLLP